MKGRYDQPSPPVEPASLFDPPPIEPMPTLVPVDPPDAAKPPRSIQIAFERYDRANPWVAIELRKMALQLVRSGHTRVSINMLFETLRYRVLRGTTDTSSPFRLNNNYRSRYSRMLQESEPELAGVFETRKVRTA